MHACIEQQRTDSSSSIFVSFFRKHIAKYIFSSKTHRKRIVFLQTLHKAHCFSENTSLNVSFSKTHRQTYRFSENTLPNISFLRKHIAKHIFFQRIHCQTCRSSEPTSLSASFSANKSLIVSLFRKHVAKRILYPKTRVSFFRKHLTRRILFLETHRLTYHFFKHIAQCTHFWRDHIAKRIRFVKRGAGKSQNN